MLSIRDGREGFYLYNGIIIVTVFRDDVFEELIKINYYS